MLNEFISETHLRFIKISLVEMSTGRESRETGRDEIFSPAGRDGTGNFSPVGLKLFER